jgi:glycosyltransferase involved in cell wall biosynthesis
VKGIRILFILPAYYPAHDFGGPVPVARDTARRLVTRGHDVTVWTTNLLTRSAKLGVKTEQREVDGIRTVYLNSVVRYRWVGITPDVFRYLRRELKSYDVVHIYGYREFLTWAVARHAHRIGTPYVLQTLGTTARMKRSLNKKLFYDVVWGSSILENAASLIAKSHLELQQYLEAGVPEEKIFLIPNGVELPREEISRIKPGSFRREHGIGGEETLILFLGRIDPIKGLDLLIRAFVGVCRRARLAIAGPDEGNQRELERLARQNGLEESVMFVGPLYDEKKWAAYLDADIYVLPSVFDNFPRTVLEAMGCDTPVIITDRCGVAPQVKDRAGLVVPYDREALARALERLVEDPGLGRKFAESGRRLLEEEFSWEPLIERLESLYENVARESSGEEL